MTTRALVLSGGGLTGVAWLTGLLARLEAEGVPVADADLVLGTSAGSVVGAQLAAGRDLQAQYRFLTDPRKPLRGLLVRAFGMMPKPAPDAIEQLHERWLAAPRSSEHSRRETGTLALRARTMPQRAWVGLIAAYLRMRRWPGRALAVAIVDAESGHERLLRSGDGVAIAHAVAASTAVPGVFPPVTIGGRRYMDGGTRSTTNADLAVEHDVILLLIDYNATEGVGPTSRAAIDAELEILTAAGRTVVEIALDEASLRAMGALIFDPSRLRASAQAGWDQGGREVERVRANWPVRP